MEEYSGLITAGAITFWLWFPLLLIIIFIGFSLVCMRIFKRISKSDIKDNEGFRSQGDLKEDLSREKKSHFFKEEDTRYLEANLEEFTRRIGEKSPYYIQSFCKRDRFNLGSAVGGVLWLGYRGMFRELFLAYALIFLLDVVFLYLGMDVNMGPIIGGILGMYGNYLYFKSLQRRIEDNKTEVRGAFGIMLALFISIFYLILWGSYIRII